MNLQFIFVVFALSSFVLGFLFALFSYLSKRFGHKQLKIERRLLAISSEELRMNSKPLAPSLLSSNVHLNAWLGKHALALKIQEAINKLKWEVRLDQFMLIVAILFIATDLILLKSGASFLLALLCGFISAALPPIYLTYELTKRQEKLETQLPEILDFIARAMQAGHTFAGSLQMAANESREPIASEFQKTFQEISFGRSIQDSMSDLSARINCAEMRYFAVAVFVNQEIGGNLSSLINGVAKLVRERLQAKRTLHAMTSEARSSAWILSVLPFAVALLMTIVRPDFIGVLWREPTGRAMVGYTLVLMFLGIIWMQRMAKIRV